MASSRSPLAYVVVTALVLTGGFGCTRLDSAPPVPVATPYEGPLRVEQTEPPPEDGPDQTGAPGLVVQCRTEPSGGNRYTAEHSGEVFSSAADALRKALGSGLSAGIAEYRKAAESADRVLYRYAPDGVAKHALVMHRGGGTSDQTGWYVESWARCDPAEFPDSVTRPTGLQIWTDAAGARVLTTELHSSLGPNHCHWEQMTFLHRGGSRFDGLAYVSHADPELSEYFDEPYQADLPLPADAVDSGYHLGDNQLWFSPDDKRAYVGHPDQVELWPLMARSFGCA